ncbi:MAG: BREX-3 system phosphatase PglZ [Pseudomonadota bacterium]
MHNWRDHLLKPFVLGISRITVVADPDEMFRDDRIFRELSSRGFTVLYFEDAIAFRFTYESQFREAWDNGENRELVVVFHPDIQDFDKLPADLLQSARELTFHLQDVFPNLSYTVVSKLNRIYFDALYRSHSRYAKQPLGDAMTREFILKHVFETVPEVIKTESDLLRLLLQRHYRKQHVPLLLDAYFLSTLEKTGRFKDWPLKAIVTDRGAFWDFLQERWRLFIFSLADENKNCVAEPGTMKFPGILKLPFEHDDIRVYMDNLFNEGILSPIEWVASAVKARPWVKVGMQNTEEAERGLRFDDICNAVQENLPADDAGVSTWLAFAQQYGQMQRVWNENLPALKPTHGSRYAELIEAVNARFSNWLASTYRGIYNYPAVTPVMVHHIPGYLAHLLSEKEASRAAFILVDGLAVDQWLLLKEEMTDSLQGATMQENILMAWIPTITPVSRQAAFSGKIPAYFTDSIYRTDRDEYGWRQFWSNRGLQLDEVGFWACHGNTGDIANLDAQISHRTRVLGCTIYKVDRIMHGIQVGAAGMASQVKAWGQEGFLAELIQRLLTDDFTVVISADHGNVTVQGAGALKDGTLSEKRGERCRIYSEPRLRSAAMASFPETIPWDHQALPKDFHCLLSPPGKAFSQNGLTIVCHGGDSMDEVMVPFVEIVRRRALY